MGDACYRLTEVCTKITDGTHYSPKDEGEGHPFLTVKDIGDGLLDFATCIHIGDKAFSEVESAGSVPSAGDVLFSKDGTVGKVAVVPEGERFGVLSSIAILKPDPTRVESRYLAHALRNEEVLADALGRKTGSALRRLVLKDLKAIAIPVPPLPQQRRISRLLDEADRLQRVRRQANENARRVLPALFAQMFGDPQTNPKGWQSVLLGEVCHLQNGRAFKPHEWGGSGLPIIRIQNLNDESKPFNYYEGDLPDKFRVTAGDILLSWSGTPGTSFGCFKWRGGQGWLNQHIFRVTVDDVMCGDFFIAHVNAQLDHMIARAHGGVGLRHITKPELEKMPLLLPPLDAQVRFSEAAERLRAFLDAQADCERRQETLVSALRQELFSGK